MAYYSVINAKPPSNESPGYYWISWKNGLIVFGYGQDIGRQLLLFYNSAQPIEIYNATASVVGTLTIPFRYYVGATGF